MRLDALTFDIDRTLVDSNPAHIDLEQLADVIANADDAKQSKPAPRHRHRRPHRLPVRANAQGIRRPRRLPGRRRDRG